MAMTVTELHPLLGASVKGVDLRRPISAEEVSFIEETAARIVERLGLAASPKPAARAPSDARR